MKESFVRAFLGGLGLEQIKRVNSVFISLCLPFIIRKSMVCTMLRHQKRGDSVYIVSASPDIYVQDIAAHFNLNGAICTRLEWKDGVLTGKLAGRNCRGDEKRKRILSLFSERDLEGSFAYGDSADDREMMALAAFAFRV